MAEIVLTSSILIGLLIFLRLLFRNKISAGLQYGLWLLAAVRLLMPAALFENPFHIMNRLRPAVEQVTEWAEEKAEDILSPAAGISETERNPQQLLPDAETMTKVSSPDRENPDPGSQEIHPMQEEPEAVSLEPKRIPEETPPALFPSARFLRNVWYAGMAVMAVWMAGGHLLCRRRLSRNRIFIGREGPVRIYVSENATTPCLLGILHPAIYLTPHSGKIPKHRSYAITHELTHYRHQDPLWTLVRNLCLVIYWFHPLVWIGAYLASRDCELACDEGVLRRMGEDRAQEYGCTLIEMAASFRRLSPLHCETALADGKRELRERLARIAGGKHKTCIPAAFLTLVCCAATAACTFGTWAAPAMGRYVETVVEVMSPNSMKQFSSIAQNGNTIRLIASTGLDVLSLDGGLTFETVRVKDMPQGTWELYKKSALNRAGSVGGARAFRTYIEPRGDRFMSFDNYLITESGEELRLELPGNSNTLYFYGNGCFYIEETGDSTNRYYQLDSATGEIRFLTENQWSASYIAADDRFLYLVNENGVLLFDLNAGKPALQDQALSEFVAENATGSPLSGEYPALLYPYGDGVYILTHRGLYWHELYGKTTEQIIDGTDCAIGNPGMILTGMALRATDGKPEFLILYDNKSLMRYTYDASLPSVPEELSGEPAHRTAETKR